MFKKGDFSKNSDIIKNVSETEQFSGSHIVGKKEKSENNQDNPEEHTFQQRMQELEIKKQELRKFFGKEINLGNAEQELNLWKGEQRDIKQEKDKEKNGFKKVILKERSQNNEMENEFQAVKKSLVLLRKKIAMSLEKWKNLENKKVTDQVNLIYWKDIFQDILQEGEVEPLKNETVNMWTRRIVKLAFKEGKISQLVQKLENL